MSFVTDPIGDLLTRMRNAQQARRQSCRAPWSKLKEDLLTLLKREEWISNVQVLGDPPRQELEITFAREKPALALRRVSKPGRRISTRSRDLMPVLRGFGIAILTTSQGLMTDREARKKNIGGELLCTIA
jgi:small subunit ribosomal protein S8